MTSNQLRFHELQETKRSNIVRENETNRANLEKEAQGRTGLAETERSNRKHESLEEQKIQEQVRSNIARETETNRSNLVNEEIKRISNELKSRELTEQERHNLEVELQAYRNYEVEKDLSGSKKFANIAGGIGNILKGVSSAASAVSSFIPKKK